MSDTSLPPFLSLGEGDARFYILAYCRGHYPGTRDPGSVAFLSIDFSTSPDFTRYSLAVRNAEGRLHFYLRGDDDIDRLEYVMLRAAEEFAIPPAYWQLYPLGEPAEAAWSGRPQDQAPYLDGRGVLCRILWRSRIGDHFKNSKPLQFIIDPEFSPPGLFEPHPHGDAVEITEYMRCLESERAEQADA